MPGKNATLATCSGAWSCLSCSISLSLAEDQAIHAHARLVALRNAVAACVDLFQRAVEGVLGHGNTVSLKKKE